MTFINLFDCSDDEFKKRMVGSVKVGIVENEKTRLKEVTNMELKYGKNDVILHGLLSEKSEPKLTKNGGLVIDVKIVIPGTKETMIPVCLFGESADIANSIPINAVVICHGRLAGEVYTDKAGVERSSLRLWSSMIVEVKVSAIADLDSPF